MNKIILIFLLSIFTLNSQEIYKKTFGKENLHYLDNCSHSVLIDQQKEFLEILDSLEY